MDCELFVIEKNNKFTSYRRLKS
nr:hypothetical protein [Borreliella lanei]